ncbi:unnamed protein product [Taenia asiatica]|uniref:Uncharacterized protein n=1 Tax=Taenia asiatica TaxID=60517 RepID=A0A0R3WET6_TAEAS|nr:unnamed protein product [Taenia asiatica]
MERRLTGEMVRGPLVLKTKPNKIGGSSAPNGPTPTVGCSLTDRAPVDLSRRIDDFEIEYLSYIRTRGMAPLVHDGPREHRGRHLTEVRGYAMPRYFNVQPLKLPQIVLPFVGMAFGLRQWAPPFRMSVVYLFVILTRPSRVPTASRENTPESRVI